MRVTSRATLWVSLGLTALAALGVAGASLSQGEPDRPTIVAASAALPKSEQIRPGTAYPFALWTHCGLGSPDFDGSRWSLDDPAPDENYSYPPYVGRRRLSDPDRETSRGTMTLISPNVAEYRSDLGGVARFRRRASPDVATGLCI